MSLFKSEENEKLVRITCPSFLDGNAAKDFSERGKVWMLSPVKYYVLDLTGVKDIHREFYQSLIHFKTSVKRDQKVIYSVNLSNHLIRQIKQDGVEQAFNPIKSIEVLLNEKPSGNSNGSLNVAVVNPFLTSTQKALEIQCSTKASAGKPFLKTAPLPDIALAGVLSLKSSEFTGSIVLCFPSKVFLKIYENMFGEKHEQITPELEDAAAELLNIIYGMAKTELNRTGYDFQMALPTVLAGEKMKIRHTGVKPAVVIPFETETGGFHIEIELNKIQEADNV